MEQHFLSRVSVIAAAITLCPSLASAQSVTTVKGALRDSLTSQPVSYATIRVMRPGEEKPVAMGVTREDGTFTLSLPCPGTYTAQFSFLGKRTVLHTFSLTEGQKSLQLPPLLASDDAQSVGAVEVVAAKPLVTVKPDRIAYDMTADPEAPAKTVLEMLRKVPLVMVDQEDNITVKGSSAFKVYVNGKPNSLISSNPKEALRGMPASEVERVEVLTDLGAKYDAEGTKAVINLVTPNRAELVAKGHSTSVGANIGNINSSSSVYSTVQMGKLLFRVSGFGLTQMKKQTMTSQSDREDFTNDQLHFLHQDDMSKMDKFNMGNLGFSGSYEFSKHDLLTADLGFRKHSYGGVGETSVWMANAVGEEQYRYTNTRTNSTNSSFFSVQTDYQHAFDDKGHLLTLSYSFNTRSNKSTNTTYYTEKVGELMPQLRDYEQTTTPGWNEHTVQVDYVNPFNDHHYMDAGLKYVHRGNSTESEARFLDGNKEQLDGGNSGQYTNSYDIAAAYTDYRYTLGKWSFRSGLRYELSRMGVDYVNLPNQRMHKTYSDLVPSAAISYVPTGQMNLKLSYNMNISRPSIGMLSPFADRMKAFSQEVGSPTLDTEKSHTLDANVGSYSGKFSYNFSLNYSFCNNGISRYSFMQDGVEIFTYGNVERRRDVESRLWVGYNPWSTTRLSLSSSLSYYHKQNQQEGYKVHGWQWSAFGNVSQRFAKIFTASAFCSWFPGWWQLSSKSSGMLYYSLSLSASLLKEKRLNISLVANNLFNRTTKQTTINSTPQYYQKSVRYQPMRNVTLSFNYRFGSLKAEVKRTQRTISNNDVKSGGDANSGGNAGGR